MTNFDNLTDKQKENLSKFYKKAIETWIQDDCWSRESGNPVWRKNQNTFSTCFNSILVEYTIMPAEESGLKGTMVYGKIGQFPDFTKTFQFFYPYVEVEGSHIPLHTVAVEKILFDF